MTSRAVGACVLLALLTGCTSESDGERATLTAASPTAATAAVETGRPPTAASAAAVTVTFDRAPPLVVEVASAPGERQRGLMQRTSLAPGSGMLFVFPGEVTGGFWMKNTLIPLSIAYVNGGRVVSTAEMTPCPPTTADCPTYSADGPYTHAVEAAAGFFPQHGVRPGTRMQIAGDLPAPQ